MKILKNLKKWIAGFTALSMLCVFVPQTAYAAVVVSPVATPGSGTYSEAQSVSLGATLEPEVCTYYQIDSGLWMRYTGTAISIDGADSTAVTLRAESFFPTTDCGSTLDDGGKVMMASQVYAFDKTAPIVSITNPIDGSLVNGFVDLKGTITDTNPNTYSVSIYDSLNVLVGGTGNLAQNGSFTNQALPIIWNTDDAQDGLYTIELKANDKAGNPDNDTITVYIDRTAPNVPVLVSPINGDVVNSSTYPNLTWSAVTDLNGPVEYQIQSSVKNDVGVDGALNFVPDTSGWQITTSFAIPSTEGIYYWQVRAKDRFENIGDWSAPWMVTIDNTAPIIEKIYDASDLTKTDVIGGTVTIVKPTTFAVDAMDIWQVVENPDGINRYEWSADDLTNIVFETPNSSETEISALKDGTYTITLEVFDKAGNASDAESFTLEWYQVPPVTDLYAVTGSGFVDLHWKNPPVTTDPEIVGLNVYRSLVKGELGSKLNGTLLSSSTEYYPDELVINGKTYYYTVAVLDELGNESQDNKQIAVTPTAPTSPTVLTPLIASITVLPSGGPDNSVVLGDQNPGGELKSGESDQNNEEDGNENNNLPAVGIALLIILALVGLYLLYLQNPKWASGLLFWKNKKKKKKTISKK